MTANGDPTPTTVRICINFRYRGDEPSCAARGSKAVADAIEAGVAERRIDVAVERSVCMGQCTKGPTVRLAPAGRFYLGTGLDDVEALLDELERRCGRRDDGDALPAHLLGS